MSDAIHAQRPALQPASERATPETALVYIEGDALLALPGESLLETLERHDHPVEYQCRSGYCGACRTPLLTGKVHYANVPLAFVAQGECLPCCCQPVGAVRLDMRVK